MSKIKKMIVAMLVSLVAVTGCGNKKNSLSLEETTKKMASNMEALQSFRIKLDAGVNAKFSDQDIIINAIVNADIDLKNQKAKVNLSLDSTEQKMNMDLYMDFDKESKAATIYMQNPDGDGWLKMSTDMAEYADESVDDALVDNQTTSIDVTSFLNNEDLKQVKPDKDNYNYEMTITSAEVKKTFENVAKNINTDNEMITNVMSMANLYLLFLNGDIDFKVSFTKDNYYLSKLSIDFKDVLNQTIKKITQDDTLTVSRADVKVDIYDYDKVGNVEIPEAIIENAVETDMPFNTTDEEDELLSIGFDKDDYDKVLSCKMSGDSEVAVYHGFNDDKYVSMAKMSITEYDSEESADEAYEAYELNSGESKMLLDSTLTITSFEEFEEDDERQNDTYDDLKLQMENAGYVCE